MPSKDELPIDDMLLDDVERAQNDYGLDLEQAKALELIRKGLPLKDFARVLSEELWLREIIKDLEASKCQHCKKYYSASRSKALQMFGEWAGILGNKSKKVSVRKVTFD